MKRLRNEDHQKKFYFENFVEILNNSFSSR